jgi:hypothetical protein
MEYVNKTLTVILFLKLGRGVGYYGHLTISVINMLGLFSNGLEDNYLLFYISLLA